MKESINQDVMKHLNAIKVFNYIREQGKATRKQVEAATVLSWGAVSNITARLLEKRYLVENKCEKGSGSGRIPSFLAVNDRQYYVLGVDINITRLTVELVNLKGESVRQWTGEPDYHGSDALLAGVQDLLQRVIGESIGERSGDVILGIGVAMQGIVDARNGIAISLPQCPGWQDIPLAALLESRFGRPVYLEHDPNCVLRAEVQERPRDSLLLLRIDKGIGMAILSEGRIFTGPGMLEIAHTIVVLHGVKCSCGGEGCLEAYVSEEGLSQLAGIAFTEAAERARNGDPAILALFGNMALYLGVAIHNILRLFQSDEIILCGDMMRYRDLFLDQVRQWLAGNSFCREAAAPKISFSENERAAYGAALMAIPKVIEDMDI